MKSFANSSPRPIGHRLYRTLVNLLATLGLIMCMVTFTPLVSWWAGKLAGPWDDPKGDLLIVLGGSTGTDGIIGESSYLRSQYATMAYRLGGFRTVVLTGGGAQRVPVSIAMANFLISQGVPRTAVLTETASTSTRENALYTRRLLEGVPGKKVLLTSDYHMFRAYRAFRKAGLEVQPRPFPDVRKRATGWRGRWPAFLDLVQETVKIGYYFARRWI